MKKIISLGLLFLKIHFICDGSFLNGSLFKRSTTHVDTLKESPSSKQNKSQAGQSYIQNLSQDLAKRFSHEQKSDVFTTKTDAKKEDLSVPITQPRKNDKKIHTDDLTKAQFLDSVKLLETMRKSNKLVAPDVRKKQLLGKTMDEWFPDVNATNKRITNLENANRATVKSILSQIKSAEFKHERTGKYNITSFASRRDIHQDTLAYKNSIAENLIQSTLDNFFGKDSMSGQSLAKFTDENHKEFRDYVIKNEDLFNSSKSDITRLNAITKISDTIMNKICESEPGSSQQPIGKIETKIDANGNYETTITNDLGATTRAVINNKGKTTSRHYQDPTTNTDFLTTFDQNGKSQTSYFDAQGNRHRLTSYEDSLVGIAYAQHKAMIIAKSILKASLWTSKQAIITLFTNPIPTTLLIVAGVGLVPLVKGGSMIAYQITGNEAYAWSSPTARSAIVHILEISCGGDRRGFISGQEGRVFKEGTMLSKTANAVNPFGKDLSLAPEKINPHEEYYTLMGEIVDIVKIPLKAMFPETLGDTLVSKAGLDAEKTNRKNFSTPLDQNSTNAPLALQITS